MARIWGFGVFRKTCSFVLYGNGVERKYVWPFMTAYVGQIWFSKILSADQISVFFNCQYLINRLTSDSEFLHIGRHEWMQQSFLMTFPK